MIYKKVLLEGNAISVPELLTAFTLHFFNETNDCAINIKVDERQYKLDIDLVASPNTVDVVLLCFCINNPVSFHDIFKNQLKLVKQMYANARIILVGIQNNSPDDVDIVSSEDARVMAKNINAFRYVESPFNSKESFAELLTTIARVPIVTRTVDVTVEKPKKTKNSCQVL